MGADTTAAHTAVEELVAHYQAKARAVGRLGVAIGASAGVLVGSVPLSPLRFAWPIPTSYGFATILAGLIVGVLIGYVIGDSRAQMYHRMAEQARLQLQLEQRISDNDTRMAQLLTALTARATAAAARPQAVQVQQPVAVAQPVQVAQPAPVAQPIRQPDPVPAQQATPPPVQTQPPALPQPVPVLVQLPPAPAPEPAQPLRPAAVVTPQPQPAPQPTQAPQTTQPYLTQVPPVAPTPVAALNGQGTPAAPPLSPPISR